MRVFGVVTELRHQPGVYGRRDAASAEQVDAAAEAWARQAASAGSAGVLSTLAAAASPLLTLGIPALAVVILAARAYRMWTSPTPIERLKDPLPDPDSQIDLAQALTIPQAFLGNDLRGVKDPHLYGLFQSNRQLRALMTAEGGHVDLYVLSQKTAREHFTHVGGEGAHFSVGLHIPHPKDPRVLVPLATAAKDLLADLHCEWVRSFEALGAKQLVIVDKTQWSGKANAAGVHPAAGDVAAELRGRYGSESVVEHAYGGGTFDPDRATRGLRWLGDYPEIRNIIDGRVSGNQTSWRRTQSVDASFGLDVRALGKAFGLGLEGNYSRSFEFAVQFHPRVRTDSDPA